MIELTEKEKDLLEGLREARFMIADPGPSSRALRDFLSRCEVKSKQIQVVSTFEEAVSEISQNRPNVIFADLNLSGGRGLELKKWHEDGLSLQDLRAFFSMSNDDSTFIVNTVADEGVDGLLVRPLSAAGLRDSFFGVLLKKLHPAPYDSFVRDGLAKKLAGDLAGAISLFEKAKRLDPSRALALAHEGRILLEKGELHPAQERFQQGLATHPNHYRCLLGLFDLSLKMGDYTEAYQRARELAEHHTLPLSRLSDFITVAIRNHQFDDVLELSRLTLVPEASGSVDQRVVSAGLLVAGLAFLRRSSVDQALLAFRRAARVGDRDLQLMKRIYCALVENGLLKESKVIGLELPPEILSSKEVQLAEFHRMQKTDDRLRTLQLGLTMVRNGIQDEGLFESLIRYSVALGRRKSVVQSLVDLGSKFFPGRREDFERLLEQLKAG